MNGFDGKVAIVTGGGSGLGESIAQPSEASFMTGGYYLVDGGYTTV